MSTNTTVPTSPAAWKAALDSLPATPDDIPAFFFAHGSPMLAFPKGARTGLGVVEKWVGPDGELANFLRAFGPTLLKKYQPKGIVVFSAHWETSKERLVTDYGDENPLLMDYFGFPRQLYEIKFKSKGDSALSHKVVQLFKDAGIRARTSSVDEKRGSDGRGFSGPGLDHGVFVPFRLMFTDELKNVPVVQASIDASMDPEDNYKLGKAVTKLRKEGILVLAGGLPIHNLGDIMCFHPDTARPAYIEFNKAIVEAIQIQESEQRFKALKALMSHKAFRLANPTPEHFVPLYIAAGAGEGGKVQVLNAMYGIPTVAFGL